MTPKKSYRCISIREHWANLILERKKIVELRNWIVGPQVLYIHVPESQSIVGKMTIESAKCYHTLKEMKQDESKHCYTGRTIYRWGWILTEVTKLKRPIKNVKGHQYVWTYDKP